MLIKNKDIDVLIYGSILGLIIGILLSIIFSNKLHSQEFSKTKHEDPLGIWFINDNFQNKNGLSLTYSVSNSLSRETWITKTQNGVKKDSNNSKIYKANTCINTISISFKHNFLQLSYDGFLISNTNNPINLFATSKFIEDFHSYILQINDPFKRKKLHGMSNSDLYIKGNKKGINFRQNKLYSNMVSLYVNKNFTYKLSHHEIKYGISFPLNTFHNYIQTIISYKYQQQLSKNIKTLIGYSFLNTQLLKKENNIDFYDRNIYNKIDIGLLKQTGKTSSLAIQYYILLGSYLNKNYNFLGKNKYTNSLQKSDKRPLKYLTQNNSNFKITYTYKNLSFFMQEDMSDNNGQDFNFGITTSF